MRDLPEALPTHGRHSVLPHVLSLVLAQVLLLVLVGAVGVGAVGVGGVVADPAVAAARRPDPDRGRQWHLDFLAVSRAHQLSRGSGVRVAVVDTGVAGHPDLRDNLTTGVDLVTSDPAAATIDDDGHGTSVAGLIAAHGRPDGSGVLGIAPRATLIPVRDRVRSGDALPDQLAAGIDAAVRAGADVINVSTSSAPSPSLAAAVQAALAADVVVVAAAGNRPRDVGVAFPAFVDGVVAVGAVGRDGEYDPISVTGSRISVTAPGVQMHSTTPDGGYLASTGTSTATAVVSGAVALIRSRFPTMTAREVVERLTATAADRGPPGHDDRYGHGVVDLVAALTVDPPPTGVPSAGEPPPDPVSVDERPAGAPPPVGAVAGGREARPLATGVLVAGVGTVTLLCAVGLLLVVRLRRPVSARVRRPAPARVRGRSGPVP
ncbi:S8 family serine peptidase [Solwaraspora sp. WMMD406]|uniref:S8 family serine peptidase n=1 Tax=Solwaraspora sp. WMMD406 TaxID=3016095 RepID=UPI002415A8F1|nr:S8 family serine peptidase [Solwaraspora sp. WMMD406]MDG4767866.1 S8 family serine peptidase [Solwaraspora sp. WMMD406]